MTNNGRNTGDYQKDLGENNPSELPQLIAYKEGVAGSIHSLTNIGSPENQKRKMFLSKAKILLGEKVFSYINEEKYLSYREEKMSRKLGEEEVDIFPIYSALLNMEEGKEKNEIKSKLREMGFHKYINHLEGLEKEREISIKEGKVFATKEDALKAIEEEFGVSRDELDTSIGIRLKENKYFLAESLSGSTSLVGLYMLSSFAKELFKTGTDITAIPKYFDSVNVYDELEIDIIFEGKLYIMKGYVKDGKLTKSYVDFSKIPAKIKIKQRGGGKSSVIEENLKKRLEEKFMKIMKEGNY